MALSSNGQDEREVPSSRTCEDFPHDCKAMGCDLAHVIAVTPYPFPGKFQKKEIIFSFGII